MKLTRHSFLSLLFIALLTVFVIFSPVLSPEVQADNRLAKEYSLKAAFLYNFARLTEWPSNTFETEKSPLNLCLIGNDPFGTALHSIRHKKIQGHPLIIQRNVALWDIAQCHILFISRSEKNRLNEILTLTKDLPILSVSELTQFAHQNGHIRFFLNNDETISLEVNLEAIKQSSLEISSRILVLATIISPQDRISYD